MDSISGAHLYAAERFRRLGRVFHPNRAVVGMQPRRRIWERHITRLKPSDTDTEIVYGGRWQKRISRPSISVRIRHQIKPG